MYLTLTSIYGKPCKVVVNGGSVTIDGKQLDFDNPLRMQIVNSLNAFCELVEPLITVQSVAVGCRG